MNACIVSRLSITLPPIDNAPQGTMGVWGKGHERLYRKPFIYNPSLNRQAPAGYHGGLGEGA